MNEDEINIKDEAEADALMAADWGALAETPAYAKYRDLIKKNFRKNVMLAQKGIQMQDLSLLHTRLEMFIDFAFAKGGPERLEFETLWQERILETQEQMHNELVLNERKAKLEVVKKPGGLILP